MGGGEGGVAVSTDTDTFQLHEINHDGSIHYMFFCLSTHFVVVVVVFPA